MKNFEEDNTTEEIYINNTTEELMIYNSTERIQIHEEVLIE